MWRNLGLSGDLGVSWGFLGWLRCAAASASGALFWVPAWRVAPLTWTKRAEIRMDQEMLDRIIAVTTAEGTLANRMGIKVLSASGTEVVATMPVAGNVQP